MSHVRSSTSTCIFSSLDLTSLTAHDMRCERSRKVLSCALLLASGIPIISGLAVRNVIPDHLEAKVAISKAKEERRNRERGTKQRGICGGCGRPHVLCLCKALPRKKLRTETKILVLQHPNEFRKKTFSTVPLLSLVLEDVQVKVGYQFEVEDLPLVQRMISLGRRPLLLFPGEEAVALEDLQAPDVGFANEHTGADEMDSKNVLILLDGTWAEAKRMALQSPNLVEKCQYVTFSSKKVCLYDSIRKEPKEYCYSTLEACARALEHLEGAFEEARYLEDVLRLMVETKLELEAGGYDEISDVQRGRKRDRRLRYQQLRIQALNYRPEARVIDEDSGAVLRSLVVDDAEAVYANSCIHSQSSRRSLATIRRRLASGFACLGIEEEGQLVAHILRCEDGCLGMIHVDPLCEDKGYGEMLLHEASAILDRAGLVKMTLIKKGNMEMESLFQRAGWTISDEKVIPHEGYLRRRWTSE